MNSRLMEILVETRKELEKLKKGGMSTHRDNDILAIRDFKRAISMPNQVNLIAEIKFASPSAGTIREKADPLPIAQMYEAAEAAAISFITEKKFFGGNIRHLPRLKRAISLPVLRKDFIIDERQVEESFSWGADAILLIARVLSNQQLKKLLRTSHTLGMAVLTEVHDEDDLEKALECGAEIIGINNRDLDTFQVSLKTTHKLAPLVPEGYVVVSESGINNREDIQFLKQTGVQAILVGTSIMKSDDVLEKARELVRAGRIDDGKG